MRKLGEILDDSRLDWSKGGQGVRQQAEWRNTPVHGVTSDSREVRPGFIFVAVRGGSHDGHDFIESAVKQGAVLVVGEDDLSSSLRVPYIQRASTREALAALAAAYYGHPSSSLVVIGVTGTSGKTTTTYLLESILRAAGHQVGMIGTIQFRVGAKIFPSTHTTPGAVELQALLAQMKEEKCTAVVMEVSSHALKQGRVDFIAFDAMVFTNLSHEHLDFHPDMEDYYQSKAILFTKHSQYSFLYGKKPVAVVNSEDPYGCRLLDDLKNLSAPETRTFHVNAPLQEGSTGSSGLQVSVDGIRGLFAGVPIQSSLTGLFNCSNIAAAVTVAHGLRISPEQIQAGIARLSGVPGRLERVANERGIYVWVDYAHKPDALEKVLKTLRAMKGNHRLITVFGCGGDRDRKKRPIMGRIAAELSDHVLVTSDNPRTENPNQIIQEILVGMEGFRNYSVEADRARAIFEAIAVAEKGDLILIAGKGHEDYQILGKEKIHFDDREVASRAFQNLPAR